MTFCEKIAENALPNLRTIESSLNERSGKNSTTYIMTCDSKPFLLKFSALRYKSHNHLPENV